MRLSANDLSVSEKYILEEAGGQQHRNATYIGPASKGLAVDVSAAFSTELLPGS